MNGRRIFKWLGRGSSRLHSSEGGKSIEDALAARAQQLREIDPRTDEQWLRMKTLLQRSHDAPRVHRTTGVRAFLRPAIPISVAVVLLFVAGILWWRNPSIMTFETLKGHQETITLADSTEVILNHTSQLTVYHRLFEKTRSVSLKGEAFFRVRHTGAQFLVSTEVGAVQVLGTQFNVRVREGWLEVGVLSGIVKVTTTRNGVDSSLTVTKDQVVVCAEGNVPEMRPALPYPEYPAWLHGKLTFDRTNLIAGCKELESQFDIVITVRSPALRKETITGTIDSRNAETALSTLARLTGNRYRHEDSSYVLY